jgi:glycosyltransferase involved in cell wall biosynthesis
MECKWADCAHIVHGRHECIALKGALADGRITPLDSGESEEYPQLAPSNEARRPGALRNAELCIQSSEISKSMRVLKTVQSYFPFQDRGGPVFKVRSLARGLAGRRHQVTVLTADLGFGGRGGFDLKVERCRWGWRAEQDQVETIYLPTVGRYRALTLNPRVIGFCQDSLRRFDLVHIYGLYDLLGPAVAHFCRKQGIPYVIEPMGMYLPIVRAVPLKRAYHRLLGNRLTGGAKFLIATSEQEREELIAGGIEESRIAVRRNGIDLPESLPERGAFRRQWDIRRDTKLILFLGRLVSKKSPDLLVEAFADWRRSTPKGSDAVLVFAGPEEGDGFVNRLKKIAGELGLNGNVRFVGPVYDEAKWQAYRDADVFVLPSQNENFGNTAAESAACGTPVIVTDRCGIAPFVGEAGLVVPHGRAELGRALGMILEDAGLRLRCQEACARMASSLSWSDPLKQNEELYEKCIAENHIQ